MQDLHPRHRLTLHHAPLELRPGTCGHWRNLPLATDAGVLNCLSEVSGIGDFARVLAASEEVATSLGSFRVLTIPALIAAKEAVGRPHDLRTVAQLRCVLDLQPRSPKE